MLHARRPGDSTDLLLSDRITDDGRCRIKVVRQLDTRRSDGTRQPHLDDCPLTGGGHRRAGVVDRRNLLAANAQRVLMVDDGHCKGCGVIFDGASAAGTRLILRSNLGTRRLGASIDSGVFVPSPSVVGRSGSVLRPRRGCDSFLGGCDVRRLRTLISCTCSRCKGGQ